MPKAKAQATVARAPKLADRVTQQLQEYIFEEQLLQGAKLPPERDLAELFEVSRTVVREAVRSLSARGLLEVRGGSGTYIRAMQSDAVTEPLGLLIRSRNNGYLQVHEIRQLLEVEIARLAAQRATSEHIAALEQTLVDLSHSEGSADAFAQADIAFHSALARATQNELFAIMLDSISDVLLQVRRKGALLPGTVRRALFHHTAILAAVTAHDAAAAQQAMRDHLEEARITQLRLLDPKAWNSRAEL